MAPEKFQIVLVLNEYGDFLSDMACGLAGSLGIGASANLGFDAAAVVRVALFDAAHGTAPDIAGKNLANPTAIFLALSLLLYQLGEIAIGQAVKNATLDLLRQGVRTRDLGGQSRPRASPRPSPPRSARPSARPRARPAKPCRTVLARHCRDRSSFHHAVLARISIGALMRLIVAGRARDGAVPGRSRIVMYRRSPWRRRAQPGTDLALGG